MVTERKEEFFARNPNKRKLIIPKIRVPKDKRGGATAKYFKKLLSIESTNQILRGKSPDLSDDPISFRRSPSPTLPLKSKSWIERLASEIFSTRLHVTPEPREYDQYRVPTDPSKGRYIGKRNVGRHLCKAVHKRLVEDLIFRHKLQVARPKIDTGRQRKKPSRKDLDSWKKERGRRINEEETRRRRRRRKVISTKRKKHAGHRMCSTCGEYHFKKQKCSDKYREMKINLIVRQIYQKADVITSDMESVKSKLDDLESAYQSMLLKVHRLQSNRVCLGSLTGLNYPGENHPDSCPCVAQREKEKLDRERREERQRKIQEEQRIHKEKRERERKKREELIEARKQRFYRRMESRHSAVKTTLSKEDSVEEKSAPTKDVTKAPLSKSSSRSSFFTSFSSSSTKSSFDDPKSIAADLTRLDEASSRRRRQKTPISERATDYPSLNILIMDGSLKSLKTEFSEEGGRVMESLVIETLPEKEEPCSREEEEVVEETEECTILEEEERSEDSVQEETSKRSTSPSTSSVQFGEFLDVMEVF